MVCRQNRRKVFAALVEGFDMGQREQDWRGEHLIRAAPREEPAPPPTPVKVRPTFPKHYTIKRVTAADYKRCVLRGLSRTETARELGVTTGRVSRAAKDLGITFRDGQKIKTRPKKD